MDFNRRSVLLDLLQLLAAYAGWCDWRNAADEPDAIARKVVPQLCHAPCIPPACQTTWSARFTARACAADSR